MRPSQVQHLKDLVEHQKSFKLIPYGDGFNLSFEAKRNFWIVSSPLFLSYPEELKVNEEGDGASLECYYEGGYVLGYEFKLDNFFNVLAWIPAKAKEAAE